MAEIIQYAIDDDDNLIYFRANKVVTEIGNGAHIVLPRKLLGKRVQVVYNKKEEKQNENMAKKDSVPKMVQKE